MHTNNSKCSDGVTIDHAAISSAHKDTFSGWRVFHEEGTILDISGDGYCRKHKFQGGIVDHERSLFSGRKQMGHRCLVVAAAAASVNFMWWDSRTHVGGA